MIVLAADTAQHAPLLQDYWRTVTDPAHLLAEGTWEFLTFAGAYGLAKGTGAITRFRRGLSEEIHEEIDREHGVDHDCEYEER